MLTPQDAPPRDDLPWLRRRTLRTTVEVQAPIPAPAPVAPAPAPAARPSDTSLDLSGPAPVARTAPSRAAAPSSDTSLDLSEPVRARPSTTSKPVAPTPPAAPSVPAPPVGPSVPVPSTSPAPLGFRPRRTSPGAPTLLTPQQPTVTLTPVQSGVGGLTVTAATSVGDGDLRLGCAYQLRSGASSLVQPVSGVTVAPAGSRRPVIRASRERFEALHLDLRQVGELDRAIVYLFSHYDAVRVQPPGTKAMVPWSGVLSSETFAGARIDVPLRRDPGPGVLVALSIYRVDGELVLRAENELLAGSVRDAVRAFGFETITWIDPTTPLV
jgi:hypothetical protein